MPSDVRPLRDLCSLIADCPHSTPVWTDSGYLVIRNQNIKGGRLDLSSPSFTDAEHFEHRIRRAKPTEGDIIFTREAPMGEVCMIPEGLECCVGQRQVLLRPNPDVVDGRYLLYALQSPQVQHEIGWNEGTGSTVSNVRIPVLESLKIPTPLIDVQREIGSVLGALDDRIDLLRQTNATLESIAQVLFKSWLIDFDPVRAKAEGREPDGMDAGTAALFPDSFEDSALGAIPKGWSTTTLGDAFELNPTRSLVKGTDAVYLEMANTPTVGHCPLERVGTRPFGSGCKFMNGDALLAKITPCLENGKAAFVDFLGEGEIGWGSTEFIVLRSGPKFPTYCAYLLARYEPFRQFAIQAMTGTSGRQRVELSRLKQFSLVSPPDERIAIAINAEFANIQARISLNDNQAKTLAELRDALLPRLISGKLRLPEAEAQLNEALA
ncbi:restriction endonuclease subunit S [Paraburkholderia tagetis]|uniref:Restriction endonuclease subunit S n=1 Tax=Paraburkholderia tagetis TaxID=2913261 RepID=A0A9X1UMG0_9BURK|nr:restriction endonuclease subunit S [Paraburkholderia tagetis]MCG5078104.1 restriction endonuclease subunit S [Paraburkholderia tagetis]